MKDREIEIRIEKLISTKLFSELTAEELVFAMQEIGSEEQYVALQKIHKILETPSASQLMPRANTVKSLHQKFPIQYGKTSIWKEMALVRVPGYVTAITLLIGVFLTWTLTSSKQVTKTKTIVMTSKRDTVRIMLKADTVFINKVVYRHVKGKDESKIDFVLTSHYNFKADSTLSASMKEKEELDNLLVTGVN